MSIKNKKQSNFSDQAIQMAQGLGVVMMAAAATLGIADPAEHLKGPIILTAQPIFATAPARAGDDSNTLRREREEAGPHYVSYSAVQRTASRSGKQ